MPSASHALQMSSGSTRRQHGTAWLQLGLPALAIVSVFIVVRRRVKRQKKHVEPSVWLGLRSIEEGQPDTTWSFTDSQTVLIGRRDTNAVCLQDTGVSGKHCEVKFSAEQSIWQLVDLGSTNGTHLNKVQVGASKGRSEPYSLCDGDKIHLGEHTVLIVTCRPSGAAPAGAQSLGDITANELLRRLSSQPQSDAVLQSLAELDLLQPRVHACKIQRQALKQPNKPKCEDTFSHFPAQDSMAVLCVADGHCGANTSEAIQQLLPDVFAAQLRTPAASNGAIAPAAADADGAAQPGASAAHGLQDALQATFASVDNAVPGEDGSTMTMLLVRGSGADGAVHVQAANVGDSAVVCADFSRMVKYHLTDNHRVTHPSELARLRETKALLTHNETRLMGLNLSRSIGDRALKEMNSGFLAEPYVSKVHTVAPEEELLVVLASDGLWDVTNANLVMRIAFRVLTDHPGDVRLLCQVLLEHAVSRRSRDDITIVVLLVSAAS